MNAVVDVREPRPLWLAQVGARWQEVLDTPSLRDLPYEVDTDRAGQLIMSPAKNIHGFYRTRIADLLKRKLGGQTIVACSMPTPAGVKVADVAWCSDAFFSQHGWVDPYAVAPEICVEIKSPSNAESELQGKVRLHLDAGAREVWLVDVKGGVRVFGANGPRDASAFGVEIAAVAYSDAGDGA